MATLHLLALTNGTSLFPLLTPRNTKESPPFRLLGRIQVLFSEMFPVAPIFITGSPYPGQDPTEEGRAPALLSPGRNECSLRNNTASTPLVVTVV